MWDAIAKILTNSNAFLVLVFLVIFTVIIIGLAHTGLLEIHTKAFRMGADDREREIIRQQVEWTGLHLEEMENTMPKPSGYKEWRGKYIVERIFDEYIDWIVLNHLSRSSSYIEIKQDKIVALVKKLTVLDYFHTAEFEEFLREDTKKSIIKLIQIREAYK